MKIKTLVLALFVVTLFSCGKEDEKVSETLNSQASELELIAAYDAGETITVNGLELTKLDEEVEIPAEILEMRKQFEKDELANRSFCDGNSFCQTQFAVGIFPLNQRTCASLFGFVDHITTGGVVPKFYGQGSWFHTFPAYPFTTCTVQGLEFDMIWQDFAGNWDNDCVAFRVVVLANNGTFMQDVCFDANAAFGGGAVGVFNGLHIATVNDNINGSACGVTLPGIIGEGMTDCGEICPSFEVCW